MALSDYSFFQSPKDPNATSQKAFAIASVLCGVLSVFSVWSGFFAISFGALGLLFCSLGSRKKAGPVSGKNGILSIGITFNIIGIVLGLVAIVVTVVSLINNPELLSQTLNIYSQYYGEDSVESLYNLLQGSSSFTA